MSRPEPPVTADHTPERLSAKEREALRCLAESWRNGSVFTGATVLRLFAHLADVEARLAAAAERIEYLEARLDADETLGPMAPHPDPSEAT